MTNYGGPRRFSSPPTAQELERLVSDLADLFERVAGGVALRLGIPLGIKREDFPLRFGFVSRVDTTRGQTIRALLPTPENSAAGKTVSLVRVSANGSIRVVPTGGKAGILTKPLIDGEKEWVVPPIPATYLLFFDGKNWSKLGGAVVDSGPTIGAPWHSPGRPYTARVEGPTVLASGTHTALDIDGHGYITQVFMSVAGSDAAGRQNTRLKVYVDGETSPSINVMLVDMACARGVEATNVAPHTDGALHVQFQSRYVGYTSFAFRGSANGVGYNIYINIPFTTHVKVEFTNGSGANSIILGGYLSYYLTDQPLYWGKYRKLHGTSINGVSVAAYAEQSILNLTSGSGLLHGFYLYMDGGDGNYNFLEGNVRAYIDGETSPSVHYDSTEDYFNFPWYVWAANNTRNLTTDFYGCTRKNDSDIVGMYRWHVPDPLTYSNGFRLTWSAGEVTAVPVVNNVTIHGVAWYYEE